MFGFSYLKFGIAAAIILAFAGMYGYIHILKGERDTAIQQVGALTTAKAVQDATISAQKEAVNQWKEQAASFQKSLQDMADVQAKSNETARKLNDVLSRHDLHALSLGKPGLIERRINSGTIDIFRMLNDASSGSDNSSR